MQVKMLTSSNANEPIFMSSSIPGEKHGLDPSKNLSVTTSVHFAVTAEISHRVDLNFCFSSNNRLVLLHPNLYHPAPYLQY